jgi:hypothetical protein
MLLKVHNTVQVRRHEEIDLRCPKCRKHSVFTPFKTIPDLGIQSDSKGYIAGHRKCPDRECSTYVFFIYYEPENKLVTFPTEFLDFDATDVPQLVVDALQEAIKCFANDCFVAAAIMVRKTLEELCNDHGVKGKNLKEKIQNLKTAVLLPVDLLNGIDDLRLLGNDAAHVESHIFNDVGKPEVEAAIEVTKELIKSLYQYKAIIQKLSTLKKQP